MAQDVLFRIFNQFPGGVRYIWLNRNLEDLSDKADKRTKLVEKLETVECKLIKAAVKNEAKRQKKVGSKVHPVVIEETVPDLEESIIDKYIPKNKRPTMKIGPIPVLSSLCFGKKVDTITYCKETISQLNTEIERAKTTPDNYAVINSAFIQFNKQIAAHMAVQSIAASVPLAMTPRYIDVKPANIVWSNLKLTYYELKVRELAMLAATTALIVFWAIPVAFVGVLSNLTYLTNKLTFLRFIYNLPSALLGLITGLLPTVLLAVLMALLPIVLKLFAKTSGIPTTDAIDRYVQGSYFVFQVVHVFLVVTISSSVSSVVTVIIENPSSAATILAANIPTASNFFFSFLALQGLSVASGLLLQIVTLILFYLLRKLFDNTPRKKWKRYFTLDSLSWGTIFPVFTNFVVITLVYSIIAPLMLFISGLAFGLFYVAYAYTMFYVLDFPNDSGGLAFPRAIFQSFTGLYLMEIMLAALFFLVQNESGSQSAIVEGILMCVLIVITIGVQFAMSASFDPLTYYLPVDAEEFSRLEIPVSRKVAWAKTAIRVLSPPGTIRGTDAVSNINDAVIESYDNTMENAYMHPAMRDPKPIVWIAQDSLGIATDEVQRTRASGLDISMSTEGARFNEKTNIKIDGPPPDHVETTESNNIRTRV
jgi:calcium permeable stress-gated cation channel